MFTILKNKQIQYDVFAELIEEKKHSNFDTNIYKKWFVILPCFLICYAFLMMVREIRYHSHVKPLEGNLSILNLNYSPYPLITYPKRKKMQISISQIPEIFFFGTWKLNLISVNNYLLGGEEDWRKWVKIIKKDLMLYWAYSAYDPEQSTIAQYDPYSQPYIEGKDSVSSCCN